MSRYVCLVIAAFTVFALPACSRSPMPASQVSTQTASTSAPSAGEMIAQLIALDQQAIAHAEQARGHESLDAPGRELVETIYMHHRRNLTQTRALGDAEGLDVVDTKAIKNQRIENAKQLEALGEVGADAYRSAYLSSVIANHQQALELIDKYMQATDNEVIRKHLERTHANFANHMEGAKALQDG